MQIHERKMRFAGDNDASLGERIIRDGMKTTTCDLRPLCTEQELTDLSAQPGWLETVIDGRGESPLQCSRHAEEYKRFTSIIRTLRFREVGPFYLGLFAISILVALVLRAYK